MNPPADKTPAELAQMSPVERARWHATMATYHARRARRAAHMSLGGSIVAGLVFVAVVIMRVVS